MAKVVHFPVATPEKLANRKIKKRRKPDMEDFGQLNLFDASKHLQLMGRSSLFDEALALDEVGDARSEQLYLLAIERGEHVEDALCNLAVIYSASGQASKAIDCLTRCLELSPRHFEAHFNLGNAYSDIGNLPLAKVHYELAILIDPEYPNTYYNLGLALVSMKQFPEAIYHIKKYLAFHTATDNQTAKELLGTLTQIAQ